MGASGIGRLVRIIAARIAMMSDSAAFERMRANLNATRAFAGLALDASGELMPEEAVYTLSEAERRAKELRADLVSRGVHPDVLALCRADARNSSNTAPHDRTVAAPCSRRAGSDSPEIRPRSKMCGLELAFDFGEAFTGATQISFGGRAPHGGT